MNNQNLIIYENVVLYDILYEIREYLQFSIIKLNKKELTKLDNLQKLHYLFISKKNIPNINNQITISKFPIHISKLIEILNIKFLKLKFNKQSKIKVGNYFLDLNAREMIDQNQNQNQKLKLTEKEINSIYYLFNVKKPVNVQELQLKVWGHQSGLETHTVETHIYRLRKKILKKFNDKQFIISTTSGYKIN